MAPSPWLIRLGVFLGILLYTASQGVLEEAMEKILMEEVRTAKGKYDTYPVAFVLYTNTKESRQRIVSTLKETGKIHRGQLNATAHIKILVHGWQHHLKKDFESNFQRAFNGTIRYVQVIAVRWKEAERDYVGARRAVPGVANQVRQYVQRLYKDYGVHPRRLAFFGHGLGAQIAGAVGHLTRGRIGKIVAMDPSMPLFWQNTHDSVNRSSAMKVIGIHTSAATFGVIWNVGHADFWAMNGMAPQKPCRKLKSAESQLRCSHEQAYKYFLETVKDKGSIAAQTCGKKYACKPKVFPKQKVMLTEFTRARGQFCFVPPKWHPWPKLKDILDERNVTELPTQPPFTDTTAPLRPPGGAAVSLAPGETEVPSPPGGTNSPPGGTNSPPGGTNSPPGGTNSPPGGTTSPLPPGASTTPDDCDAMIRMHHALLHGSRGLRPPRHSRTARMRALRAKIKKCEDLKSRMKRISRASWRRHHS